MKKYAILFLSIGLLAQQCKEPVNPPIPPVGQWTAIGAFPGESRYLSIAFVIGEEAYVGTGGPGKRADFYAYQPANDTWTKKADLPVGREAAVGFSLLGKGYVVSGYGSNGPLRDCWEYNPATDSWTQLPDFPGLARYHAVAVAIGNKAYLGTGWQEIQPGLQKQLKDWWEFDPQTGTWTPKSDFPGGPCALAAAAAVDQTGYVGLAGPGPEPGIQWWAYSPEQDQWTSKSAYRGKPRYGLAFSR